MWANPSNPQHFSQMCSAKLTIIYQYVQRPVLGQKLCSKSLHRLEGGKVKLHEHHCEQGRRTFKCTITHAWTADLDHVQTTNSLARSSLTRKYYGNGLGRKNNNVKTGMVSHQGFNCSTEYSLCIVLQTIHITLYYWIHITLYNRIHTLHGTTEYTHYFVQQNTPIILYYKIHMLHCTTQCTH